MRKRRARLPTFCWVALSINRPQSRLRTTAARLGTVILRKAIQRNESTKAGKDFVEYDSRVAGLPGRSRAGGIPENETRLINNAGPSDPDRPCYLVRWSES